MYTYVFSIPAIFLGDKQIGALRTNAWPHRVIHGYKAKILLKCPWEGCA